MELRAFAGRDPVTERDRYKAKTVKGGRPVERWVAAASVAKDWSTKTILETRRIIDTRLRPVSTRLDNRPTRSRPRPRPVRARQRHGDDQASDLARAGRSS